MERDLTGTYINILTERVARCVYHPQASAEYNDPDGELMRSLIATLNEISGLLKKREEALCVGLLYLIANLPIQLLNSSTFGNDVDDRLMSEIQNACDKIYLLLADMENDPNRLDAYGRY